MELAEGDPIFEKNSKSKVKTKYLKQGLSQPV